MKMQIKGNRTHVALQSTATGIREDVIVKIVLHAPAIAGEQRMPLNLGIVIDRSGSMGGSKLRDAIQAADRIVQRLGSEDYCTIVSFDDEVALLADNLNTTPANQRLIQQALKLMQAGGSTHLSGGWSLGVDTVLRNPRHETCVNRVMLLTDGEANVGITDNRALGALCSSYASRNVSTSTYGLGLGYNESLLNTMAQSGHGNHYFIERSSDIERFFGSELSEVFAVALQQCQVHITVPNGLSCEILGGMPHQQNEQFTTITLGAMIAQEQRSIYLRLTPDAQTSVGEYPLDVTWSGQANDGSTMQVSDRWNMTVCSVIEAQQHPEDTEISVEASTVDLAYQSLVAGNYNRTGDYGAARQVMSDAKSRSASLSRHAATDYEALESEMMAPRSSVSSKRAFMAAARTRHMSGKDLGALRAMLAEYEAQGEQGIHVDLLRRQIDRLERNNPT